jgi:hypothetical protein
MLLDKYIGNPETVLINIKWTYFSPALLSNIQCDVPAGRIIINEESNVIKIIFEREIPKPLYEDIVIRKENIVKYIIGYINPILGIINQQINNLKFEHGQLLNRSFSIFDVRNLQLVGIHDSNIINLQWPIRIVDLPGTKDNARLFNQVYIRDLIDASTSYFYYDLDDCIRRTITSLENFFILKGINGSFKIKLKTILDKKYYLRQWEKYINMFYSNIEFIYQTRNAIVHDKFRMPFNHINICKRGIGTLFYIYQNSMIRERSYVLSLMHQFVLIDGICSGVNLDDVSEASKKEDNIIKNLSDLDEFMFSGLKISDEQKAILNKRDK